MSFDTIKDRLEYAIAKAELDRASFAVAMGISYETVGRWIRGGKIPAKGLKRRQLEAVTGVNAKWIETGDGEMLHTREGFTGSKNKGSIIGERPGTESEFPVIYSEGPLKAGIDTHLFVLINSLVEDGMVDYLIESSGGVFEMVITEMFRVMDEKGRKIEIVARISDVEEKERPQNDKPPTPKG